jgi:hypothetical protein
MNKRSLPFGISAAVIAAIFAVMFPVVVSGAAATNAVADTNLTAKADETLGKPPFIEPPVPQSVFVIPKNPKEGKDPFFPKSIRPYGIDPTPKVSVPAPVVVDLTLRGISGSTEKPLAIINTTTLTVGEENDVLTQAGRLRIRCLDINVAEGTVLIQYGGERRLLRLAPVK